MKDTVDLIIHLTKRENEVVGKHQIWKHGHSVTN